MNKDGNELLYLSLVRAISLMSAFSSLHSKFKLLLLATSCTKS